MILYEVSNKNNPRKEVANGDKGFERPWKDVGWRFGCSSWWNRGAYCSQAKGEKSGAEKAVSRAGGKGGLVSGRDFEPQKGA